MSTARRKTGTSGSGGGDGLLGELLGTLGAAISEMITRLDEGGAGEVRRDVEFKTDKGAIRAEAGVRVRLAGGEWRGAEARASRHHGRPAGEEARASTDMPVRPINAEVLDDGTVWRLTADIPGVARDDLVLVVEDGMLALSATARGRRYMDRIALPAGTSHDMLRVSLQNGILEIETPSANGSAL
jgi:HSP20 family molecular chaperone IbpA